MLFGANVHICSKDATMSFDILASGIDTMALKLVGYEQENNPSQMLE